MNKDCTQFNGVDKNTPLYDSCINNPDVEIDAAKTKDKDMKDEDKTYSKTEYSDTYSAALQAYENAGFV